MFSGGLVATGLAVAAASTASADTVTPPDGVQEIVSTSQAGPRS